MRRSFSLLAATLIVAGTTAASFAPAQAAARAPAYAPDSSGSIVQVLNGHRVDGDGRPYGYYPNERRWGNNWNNDDDWRYRRHHRRHDNFFPQRFLNNFPFAFAPRHHYRSRDCYRTWDGGVYCR